jgi:hypothetical protein
MVLLYGCGGRLTAENSGFRPGQFKELQGGLTKYGVEIGEDAFRKLVQLVDHGSAEITVVKFQEFMQVSDADLAGLDLRQTSSRDEGQNRRRNEEDDVLAGMGLSTEEATAAAEKVQAIQRGNLARRQVAADKAAADGAPSDDFGVQL